MLEFEAWSLHRKQTCKWGVFSKERFARALLSRQGSVSHRISQEKDLSHPCQLCVRLWESALFMCHCSWVTSEVVVNPQCHFCLAIPVTRCCPPDRTCIPRGIAHVVSPARGLQVFSLIARRLLGGWTVLYSSWHSCTIPAPVSSLGVPQLLKWTNCLCFRAIRKWEPYGGSLASVGRITCPKGRMYIPFSWNKWVQTICLIILFVHLFHPLLICKLEYGVMSLQVGVDGFSTTFWSTGRTQACLLCSQTHISSHLAFSKRPQLGKKHSKVSFGQEQTICRSATINGSSYSLIPPWIMILEGARSDGGTSCWCCSSGSHCLSLWSFKWSLPCSGTLEVLQEIKWLPWPRPCWRDCSSSVTVFKELGHWLNSFEPMPALVVAFQPL